MKGAPMQIPSIPNSELATKSDLNSLESKVKSDFNNLKSDMSEFKSDVKSDFRELKSDVDARFTRAEGQLVDLQTNVARISGQMPHMATAEDSAKLQGQITTLSAEMKAGFAEIHALFAERIVPLEEHKRKSESRHRYVMGVLGAVVVGIVVTVWKVFIGA